MSGDHVAAEVQEVQMGPGLLVTTDVGRMDLDWIHRTLSESYWATGIPRETVLRSMRHSLAFALLEDGRQVGFARAITDRATYAYLADVVVDESRRGRGLGHTLIRAVLSHPDLQGLRRLALATRDAHALYARFGFAPLDNPASHMEVVRTSPYEQTPSGWASRGRGRREGGGVSSPASAEHEDQNRTP